MSTPSKRSSLFLAAAVCLQLSLTVGAPRAALTLTLVEDPVLGRYFSGASGRQFILNTDGTVSGTDAADYISGALAGRFTVADDASPSSIVILVDNISTSGGLTVTDAICSYDGGADASCDGAGMTETSAASALLRVGLDVSTSQIHGGGDMASVMMDVSVSYL